MNTALGPWPAGMDMRSADSALEPEAARLLVDYVQNDAGQVSPRKQLSIEVATTAGNSLVAHAGQLYYISDRQLHRCVPGKPTVALGIFAPSAVWAAWGERLYGFVGVHRLCIDAVGNIMDWGVSAPIMDADGVLLDAPPFGDLLVPFGGVLLIGKDNTVRWTEPFMPEVCDIHAAAITLPFDLVLIAPTQNGVWFVGRDSCVFAAGKNPRQWELSRAFDVGALGNAFVRSATDKTVVYWLSAAGVVAAGDGVVAAPQNKRISLGGEVVAAFEYAPGQSVFALDSASSPSAHPDFTDALTAAGV